MIYPAALLLLAGAAAFAIFMPEDERVFGLSPGQTASLVGSVLLLVLILGGLRADWRGRARTAILSALAWVAIFGVVMVGYVHRGEVARFSDRMMDEIAPGRRVVSPPGEAHAVRGPDGHYVFEGLAEGVALRLMFDTGASTVVLRAQDAARLGLDPAKLDYRVTVSTANGVTQAAPYVIRTLTIGAITLRDVRALIARPGALRENLLGQSFLERLSGYAMERNRIVLRQ
jgi:aspartyl protease family protein